METTLLSQQDKNTVTSMSEPERASKCCVNPLKGLLDQDSPHSVLVGMMLFALSTVFVTLMGTFAKLLVSDGMPVFETVLARSSLMVVFSIPFLLKSGADPRGNRRFLLLLRGCLGFGSVSSIFWAVKFLPLSDATVLSFLAPLFVAITAPVVLKEAPPRMALLALPICLVGVVLVAHPTFLFHGESLSTVGIVIGVFQALFSATAKMSVRALRSTEADAVIVFWMSCICTIGSASACLILPHHFRCPVSPREWLLLLGTGLAGFGNQMTLTMGLRRAPATPAIAMSYMSVIWGLLSGFTLFNEVPTLLSLLGAALICGCTLLLSLWRGGVPPAKRPSTKVDEAAVPLLDEEDNDGVLSGSEDEGVRDGVVVVVVPEGAATVPPPQVPEPLR